MMSRGTFLFLENTLRRKIEELVNNKKRELVNKKKRSRILSHFTKVSQSRARKKRLSEEGRNKVGSLDL